MDWFYQRNPMKLLRPVIAAALLLALDGLAAEQTGEPASLAVETVVTIAPRLPALTKRIGEALKAKGPDYQPRTEHLLPDGSPRYTNRLILEDSPYLIQHAHNPVDWHTWGPEAFEKAKRENKPIFLSIGYSTCHWCHVMERESFDNPVIADILNRHFIAIKVDRERRPDVDETYMTAVTLISGRGGWPMSSFLTPDGKPFYGATYFPPEQFRGLLIRVTELWEQKQAELIGYSDRVAKAVAEITGRKAKAGKVDREVIEAAAKEALANHDEHQGGFFGPAPKFPHESLLFLLLKVAERNGDQAALAAVETTLDAMARGGIYDQVGGGFHRYATDREWLVPHFEKMLYNQAHLGRVYLLAWRLSGNLVYRRIATQTLDYVLRDMASKDGAFYSATDADSEGKEGTFFLWTPGQIRKTLSAEDAKLAIELFGVTESGNFEGSNILHLPLPLTDTAEQKRIPLVQLQQQLDRIRSRLYLARERRQHPLRDEKILTAWNGMMISTLAQAGVQLGNPRYTQAAERAAQFIWDHNREGKGALWRVHLDGGSSIPANHDDYAYYAEGLLHLYDATGDAIWLARGREVADAMLARFWDGQAGGFYMSQDEGRLTPMGRPKDGGGDNTIPSGNSVALRVLQMLAERSDNPNYGKRAQATLAAFAGGIERRPSGFGYMLSAADDLLHGELGARRYAARGGVRVTARLASENRVAVEVEIPEGWHINADQPLQESLIPTALSLSEDADGWELGKISYPAAEIQRLGFLPEPLALYHGKVQIAAELKPAAARSRILPLRLGLQACNDRVCLPPEEVELRLPIASTEDLLP